MYQLNARGTGQAPLDWMLPQGGIRAPFRVRARGNGSFPVQWLSLLLHEAQPYYCTEYSVKGREFWQVAGSPRPLQ